MIVMERSEPTLVPQWLRNNGGGTRSGVSRYHIASSDDASLQKQNRTSRSFNNTDGSYSSFVDRKNGTSSRRSLNNNASNKHDKHFHARIYSSNNRNHRIDRERIDVDTWDTEFSDSMTSLMIGKFQNGSLRPSRSMNVSRPRELSIDEHKLGTDLKNKNYSVKDNGNVNGVVSTANGIAAPNKVPCERDFPILGSDVRPPTPDFSRVLSPRLSPPRAQNGHQVVQTQRIEELPFVGSKRLIPLTPSSPKTLVLNPSDILKPKAAMKPNEAIPGSAKSDGPKSFSLGKMLLLKRSRENDLSSQVANVPNTNANGQSTCSSVTPIPIKTPQNMKRVDKKKCSLAHARSRNDFFNMVRKKSIMSNTTCVDADSGSVDLCNNKCSDDAKEMDNGTQSVSVVKCNGDDCTKGGLNNVGAMCTNAEEEAFLRSLGWEDSAEDEDGLTEEEINSFIQKLKIMTQSDHLKWKSASKSWESLQLKISAQSDSKAT